MSLAVVPCSWAPHSHIVTARSRTWSAPGPRSARLACLLLRRPAINAATPTATSGAMMIAACDTRCSMRSRRSARSARATRTLARLP
eukprot:scaffold117627_cov73-Phaeocystis_antarctica.AAC.3